MRNQFRVCLAAGSVFGFLAGVAAAQLPKVAIVCAASGTATSNTNFKADVQAKLSATAMFSAVDVIDAGALAGATPTLAQLQQYGAILTFSNGDYQDAVALGNLLADYVDAGGGVVTAVFTNASPNVARLLGGRWITADYEIIRSGSGLNIATDTLGTVVVPGHPIMAGVSTFSGAVRPSGTTLSPHGQLITQWANGRVLVATSTQFPGRVDLGMFPVSSDATGTGWSTATDGARLMANALTYVVHPPATCYANCDASTSAPALNVADFTCFLQKYAGNDPYANCDASTSAPTLNVADFTCFLQKYATGCP